MAAKLSYFRIIFLGHFLKYHYEFQSLQNLVKEPNVFFSLKSCIIYGNCMSSSILSSSLIFMCPLSAFDNSQYM